MITTLCGNNQIELRQKLNSVVDDFIKKESALALEKFDAQETQLDSLVDAVASVPFLASEKMVVLSRPSSNKDVAENIEQLISTVSPTTNLIIYEPLIDKRSSLYKFLKSNTSFEEINKLDDSQLPAWIVNIAKKQGASISIADAKYLIDRVGTDQMLIFNEVQKLAIYSKDITKESIDLLVEKTPQSKIFDLLDASFEGNKKKALELYDDQRLQKVEPQAILALLIWQLQILAYVKYANKMSAEEIAKRAGLSAYPVQKAQKLAKRISDHDFEALLEKALNIDYKSKTSSTNIDEALKTYILAI